MCVGFFISHIFFSIYKFLSGLATSTTKLTELNDEFIHRHKGMSKNMTTSQLNKILNYIMSRFLKDFPSKISKTNAQSPTDDSNKEKDIILPPVAPPAMHLKIFYQVFASPPVELLTKTIRDFQEASKGDVNFAFSVLPANHLQNFSTFLSICGIRHEQ
jgi:diphthine-ammonia ligase